MFRMYDCMTYIVMLHNTIFFCKEQRYPNFVFYIIYYAELNELSLSELNEVLLELEAQIKDLSEVLIAELALRDELEFEKELKNSFIAQLLLVQTKRRQHNLDRKKNKNGDKAAPNGVQQSKVSRLLEALP